MLQPQRTCSRADILEKVTDYKLLKEKPANLSDWEIAHTSPEKMHAQKTFEGCPESQAELTSESSLVQSQNVKNAPRGGWFCKCTKQQKITRHKKRKGKWPKEMK